jgi:hypothetical protein
VTAIRGLSVGMLRWGSFERARGRRSCESRREEKR